MTATLPRHCKLHHLEVRGDARGSLIALEGGAEVPFAIARVYYIFGTEAGVARGFHAHRRLWQLAVCVSGSCMMVLDDGRTQARVAMDRPDIAIQIPPLVWHEMDSFSPDCVLMVLASDVYDEQDYIRSYDDFKLLVDGGPPL